MNNQKRHILVLGGGGAKGTLQIEILKELELKGELDNIDLIFGSSVGGIHGAILASRVMTIKQLKPMYKEFLNAVFEKRSILSIPPIYDRNNFSRCWNGMIGTKRFGEVKIPLVLTSVDMVEKKQLFYKSYKQPYELLLDMVMLTFPAPYYFGTIDDDVREIVHADGGMGIDNLPITEALFEAISLGWLNDDINITIVGTGFKNETEDFEKVRNKSTIGEILDYIRPNDGGLARVLSRTRQLGQLKFFAKIFDNFHFDYYDIEIPNSLDKMDNIKDYDKYIKYGLLASQKPLLSK